MPELGRDALEWQPVHPRAFRRVFVRAAAFVSVVSALGAAGRLHAVSTFAPESVARRYVEVYRSAIAGAPT